MIYHVEFTKEKVLILILEIGHRRSIDINVIKK